MPKTKGPKGTKVTLKMAKQAMRTTRQGRCRLTLANMRIVVFPKCIFKLGNIDELDLSRNLIENIPDEIGELQSLKVLDLHSNKLEVVPEKLGNLVSLEELNISNNLISSLPSTLGSLSNLRVLNIGLNKLDSLPLSLDKLLNLEELGIFDNQFKTLPNFVDDLPSLIKLNFRRNPVWYDLNPNRAEESGGAHKYLVHENNLCKTCLTKCQRHHQSLGGKGNSADVKGVTKEAFKVTALAIPNSVVRAKENSRVKLIF